ncbi:MAG: 2,4-dihydroxyhept-2-ene-1,7-dioic acid aldolase, partial [Candidatus Limnocylindrales bacterium]
RFDHADYLGALERVVAACRAHGKAAGILVYDTAVVPGLLETGFTFVGVGADAAFVADGAKRYLAEVRG